MITYKFRAYPFLKSAPSLALQQAVFNLGKAYENFFKGRAKFPKFKKKKHTSSIYLPWGFKIEDKGKWLYLNIPKIEKVIPVYEPSVAEAGSSSFQ